MPSIPPPDYTGIHENLIELYCLVEPEDIELSDLFNSVHLFRGGLAFSNSSIRRYSSNRRQNIRRRAIPSTRVFVAADFYPIFAPNEFIDTLLTSQLPPSTRSAMSRTRGRGRTARGDDVDDVIDFTSEDEMLAASLGNLNVGTGGSRTRTTTTPTRPTRSSSSRTPPPGKNTRTRTTSGVLPLAFTPTPNLFGIQLFHGGRMRDDDGGLLVDCLLLGLPFLSEEDIKNGRTSLALDMENGLDPNGYGSSILTLTCPIIPFSMMQAMPVHIQTAFEVDFKAYHEGNNVGITDAKLEIACQVTIDNCTSAYASIIDEKTKQAQLETYRLKLPINPSTGKQIYVHSNFWQGEDWNSRHDSANAELKGAPNLVPIPQHSMELTAEKYEKMMGVLMYRLPITGNEDLDLSRLTSPNVTPKKMVDRLQASRMVKVVQEQANSSNRRGTSAYSHTNINFQHPSTQTQPTNTTTQQNQYNPTAFAPTTQQNPNYNHAAFAQTQQNQFYTSAQTQSTNTQQNHQYNPAASSTQTQTQPMNTTQQNHQFPAAFTQPQPTNTQQNHQFPAAFTQTQPTSNTTQQNHQFPAVFTQTQPIDTQQNHQFPATSTHTQPANIQQNQYDPYSQAQAGKGKDTDPFAHYYPYSQTQAGGQDGVNIVQDEMSTGTTHQRGGLKVDDGSDFDFESAGLGGFNEDDDHDGDNGLSGLNGNDSKRGSNFGINSGRYYAGITTTPPASYHKFGFPAISRRIWASLARRGCYLTTNLRRQQQELQPPPSCNDPNRLQKEEGLPIISSTPWNGPSSSWIRENRRPSLSSLLSQHHFPTLPDPPERPASSVLLPLEATNLLLPDPPEPPVSLLPLPPEVWQGVAANHNVLHTSVNKKLNKEHHFPKLPDPPETLTSLCPPPPGAIDQLQLMRPSMQLQVVANQDNPPQSPMSEKDNMMGKAPQYYPLQVPLEAAPAVVPIPTLIQLNNHCLLDGCAKLIDPPKQQSKQQSIETRLPIHLPVPVPPIAVNQEQFPSSDSSNDIDQLQLIKLNQQSVNNSVLMLQRTLPLPITTTCLLQQSPLLLQETAGNMTQNLILFKPMQQQSPMQEEVDESSYSMQQQEPEAMQVDDPTQHSIVHQQSELNEESPYSPPIQQLIHPPQESVQPSLESELPSNPNNYLLQSIQQQSASQQNFQMMNLPVLGAPLDEDKESSNASTTSSLSLSSMLSMSSTFMLELDAAISSAAKTQAELLQDAEASERKLDVATAVSINIATTIHANHLFEKSIRDFKLYPRSPPSHSSGKEYHHHGRWKSASLEKHNSAKYSSWNSIPKASIRNEKWRKVSSLSRFSTMQAARDVYGEKRISKRKAGDTNLDRDTQMDSVRSSLREYDSLMSRKVHSDPENMGKEKYSRVLALDSGVVKKLFVDD